MICNITQMHIWSLTAGLAITWDICYLSHCGKKNLCLIVSEFLCRLLAPVLSHIFAIPIIQITCDYLKDVHSLPRSVATLSWYHLPEHVRLGRFLKLEKWHQGRESGSSGDDIHHWKTPLLVSYMTFRVTLNKQKITPVMPSCFRYHFKIETVGLL